MTYSLFWDEERNVYELRHNDRTLGKLADNPTFAQLVLRAFNDQAEWHAQKDVMRAMRLYGDEISKLAKELDR